MRVNRVDNKNLQEYLKPYKSHTIFTSFEWLSFLSKNQKATPVVLELYDNEDKLNALFVGMLVTKFGIKILGSPFEGWLTPDMGFIKIAEYNIKDAINSVADYAFKKLGCLFVQIQDKNIHMEDAVDFKWQTDLLLHIDITVGEEDLLQSFTKNGRRDVRASERKGLIFKQVPFNKDFADVYYDQLVEVFKKQNLQPNYSKQKIYDLVDAFTDSPEKVLALEALTSEGECAGTVFSFGLGRWAYYMGAASYSSLQKMLPNEGLMWTMIKYWKDQGITDIDLVGDREYKHKYNPEIIEQPVIIIERIPGLLMMKNCAKKTVVMFRKLCGKLSQRKNI